MTLADVLTAADAFFRAIGLAPHPTTPKARSFSGPLGALKLIVKAEGGHYTFVQVDTDQMGESRLDHNVKKFFVSLHRHDDPSHVIAANY
jgi:hypothetical protein